MKNLLCLILLVTGLRVAAQSPQSEAFTLIDSLLQAGDARFEITEFDFPPDVLRILLRFNNAVAANKDWFTEYSSHAVAGQPLPYDEKFGITRGEYDRIKNMDKLHPALKIVDTQKITILHRDGKISFKGEGEGRVLNYLEFDVGHQALTFAGDTIPFSRNMNTTFVIAYGLSNSYTWRLEKTDVNKTLQANQLTARVVEVDLGIRQPDNKLLLRILYQDMENGVSHANLDLAGYIH
ncbi:hypothetical protein Q4E93_01545 [Flavitalea sp. BT771]|uniref:hypothetical protein n=1 Tax=Flavitalea sp. BT771 TaxID=3063329 RepID=UPI0026E2D0AA|nr:hypothetical protein [Flavitalea sp. BT771]MDO6429251.1 hypothetical protein [Flavitalea sp. BT771]MDV6218621.1 hypothetical protein [Flavitalea sp. BT771]